MDGDDLNESEPSEPKTLAEIFTDVFPYYLAMGMTYDEYWRGCPSLVRAYRKAQEIKNKNEEWARWRQGLYIYNALLCASPVLKPFVKDAKPVDYLDRPLPLTEREAKEQEETRERENYEKVLARRRAESNKEKQRRAAAEKQEA